METWSGRLYRDRVSGEPARQRRDRPGRRAGWGRGAAPVRRAGPVRVPVAAGAGEAGRVDTNGALVHPGGSLTDVAGLKPVLVPGLVDTLVYDSSRVFLVLGQDSTAELSTDFAFDRDAIALRVKARANVAAPDKDKAIRKLTVSGGATARTAPAKKTAA